ncbi:Nramp family divalent metal transporter [Mesorhizobium sp. BR1-1-3]|uniref:Natural resistance-associated macrophage protein n=1 Tax=Mesorhizobium ciceri biovar biserrulae (strain HAMBI 2942 / LMG 23838 / WSM1271) TaxID=765698 RepID=E8TEE9_MESCW|nr:MULTISPECIES: Nramp family divalent metal transporter [Mesorhizobium]ADV14564.1 natural resistance-associated macrophage protein [Mesorhizobium ciceri biovar biserrulae WSM1271]MBZ9891648.1 Nramp family divalent metal transporter [Mesorhizobium sp. BR1-1-3]
MNKPPENAGQRESRRKGGGVVRALGLGLITGAADDDCSAIGTYASAGARFGPDLLWTAPVTLPMMYLVVYLSSKLGQVSGRGLFQVISDFYPRWLLWFVLVGVLIGNTIEAAADLGAMSAAIVLFVPLPAPLVVTAVAVVIFALQVLGSYKLIRNVFRWLALALLAYVVSAVLAKPDAASVLRGTLLPQIEFSREYLSILVAIVGTTLSAYLYTWQSNQEVEEEIAKGRTSLEERKGATEGELRRSRRDILIGMTFSNLIMYFIILSTGSTLYKAGHTQIETAAQAAEALRPLAGDAAGILFAAGVIGVGFLAVPIMTAGAAFDFAQAMGWKNSLHAKPRQAPKFYIAIGVITLVAVGLNFFGFNPMKALVWSGIVQGFSTPPLLLLILIMTNNRKIMGDKVNSTSTNILGGVTTLAIFAASAGLVASWFL